VILEALVNIRGEETVDTPPFREYVIYHSYGTSIEAVPNAEEFR
jgi:hypothetical protein